MSTRRVEVLWNCSFYLEENADIEGNNVSLELLLAPRQRKESEVSDRDRSRDNISRLVRQGLFGDDEKVHIDVFYTFTKL